MELERRPAATYVEIPRIGPCLVRDNTGGLVITPYGVLLPHHYLCNP